MKKESTKELIKEHTRLVKVLKSGTKSEQLKEAKKQGKELKEYKADRKLKRAMSKLK